LQEILKEIIHRKGRKTVTNTRIKERIKFKREIHERIRAKEIANIFNSANHQNPKMTKMKEKNKQCHNQPGGRKLLQSYP
jgi:hypothetical protein